MKTQNHEDKSKENASEVFMRVEKLILHCVKETKPWLPWQFCEKKKTEKAHCFFPIS